MYILQEVAEQFRIVAGSKVQAVATLKDEYGGVAHIAIDDRCYVLFLETMAGSKRFKHTAWWFKEAVHVLHCLPLPDGTDVEEQHQERTMRIIATAKPKATAEMVDGNVKLTIAPKEV